MAGVDRTQGRQGSGRDRRQADDDDGLRIVKRGRCVEAEIQRVVFGLGNGGNVLVLGGVQAVDDADEVDNRTYIGRVGAGTGQLRVRRLIDEVGAGTV